MVFPIGGGTGMAMHGNEWHTSAFVTQTEINTHAALTTGIHGVGAGTVAKVGDITTAIAAVIYKKANGDLCVKIDGNEIVLGSV